MFKLIILGSAFLALPLFAQHDENIEILYQGSGKVEDERKILYSGSSDSAIVKDHRAKTRKIEVQHANLKNNTNVRRIYRCNHNGNSVYADDENKVKFNNCVKISEHRENNSHNNQHIKPKEALPTHKDNIAKTYNPDTSSSESCNGAISFKGNTYIFNDSEPCPIPEEIFQNRKPLEALPEYYN